MSRLALRADVSDNMKERLSKFMSEQADGFIVAREVVEGENPHIHAILELGHGRTLKSVRSAWTRAFPECVGNKGYSLKVCDDDWSAYVRYICKGTKDTPPVIWCWCGMDYNQDVIKSAWEKYWVNNAALEENRVKRVGVEKGNVIEQLEKVCKGKGFKGGDRKEVALEYIRMFRDARKGINVFAARAVVNTVCCLLDGGDSAAESLAWKIAEL